MRPDRKRFVLCQISNELINPDAGKRLSLSDNYYEDLYENREKDGYYRPDHFWELPLWIGEMTYTLSEHNDVHLHIVKRHDQKLPTWSDNVPTFYCFSVLDVNKGFILDQLAHNHPSHKYCFGGYIKNDSFMVQANELSDAGCRWFDKVSDLCGFFDTPYSYGTDWSLFYGTSCIPRLTMSYGCSHRCRFCTVPNDVKAVSLHDVMLQALSFNGLRFKLVYLNDKTFGQSDNWDKLGKVYNVIKTYNQDFQGFIVQTSVAMALKADLKKWSDNGVRIVELGVESYNDALLKQYRKPQTSDMIQQAVDKLSDNGLAVIANIMLGLIGETALTYSNTLGFIMANKAKLYALNVYTLALYADAAMADDIKTVDASDADELSTDRSFWTDNEREDYRTFSPVFYALGSMIVRS